jgi:hypothetical protein
MMVTNVPHRRRADHPSLIFILEVPLVTVNSLWGCDITRRMQHSVHDEELFMEEALAAIRRAISNNEAGETTLAPRRATDLPRTSGRETNTRGWIAVPRSNCRSRLCVQHAD